MKPRPYQQEAFDAIVKGFEQYQTAIACLPTGCGKTILFAMLIHAMCRKGRTLVFAHTAELVHQAADKIERVTGLRPGIEMAELTADMGGVFSHKSQIVVATFQTLTAAEKSRLKKFKPDDFALVVVDEAHRSCAKMYRAIIDYFRANSQCKILGVTATPDRTDGKALGVVFEHVAYEYTIENAIDDGWLVPVDQKFCAVEVDFSKAVVAAGDFTDKSISDLVGQEEPLHKIAKACLERTEGRQTIVFAPGGWISQTPKQIEDGEPTRRVAEALTEIINREKPGEARFVCGETPKPIRKHMLSEYSQGKFRILVNIDVASEGFDEPRIGCVVIARPTKSRSKYAQMLGRGMRAFPSNLPDQFADPDARKAAIAASEKASCLVLNIEGYAGNNSLIHAGDILGGKFSEEVRERARKIAEERDDDESGMAMDDLVAAHAQIEEERKAAEEKRRRLVAQANYFERQQNPLGRGNSTGLRSHIPKSGGEPMTLKQYNLIRNVIRIPIPSGSTKAWASRTIGEHFMREKNGWPSLRQLHDLSAMGVDGRQNRMTRKQASEILAGRAAAPSARSSGEFTEIERHAIDCGVPIGLVLERRRQP